MPSKLQTFARLLAKKAHRFQRNLEQRPSFIQKLKMTGEEYTESLLCGLLICSWWADSNKQIPCTDPVVLSILRQELYPNQVRIKEEIVDFLQQNLAKDLFQNQLQSSDQILHFYEIFIKEFNPGKRRRRGVYYTPKSIANFVVQSIDQWLIQELGIQEGLASTVSWKDFIKQNPQYSLPSHIRPEAPLIQILDPAMGTGVFLLEVIECIYKKWQSKSLPLSNWQSYVQKSLIPRLYGYELLSAPYVMAHLLMMTTLLKTGCRLADIGSLQLRLCNSLDPEPNISPYSIILGNPPYGKMSANLRPEHQRLIFPFRHLQGKKIKEKGALAHEINLNDDYVKFYGLLHQKLSAIPIAMGVYVSNSGFLSSRSLRGMRWNLIQRFNGISNIDLGGRLADKKNNDENLFAIEQGISIGFYSRCKKASEIQYHRLCGSISQKENYLFAHTLQSIDLELITPQAPDYLFHRNLSKKEVITASWTPLQEIFPGSSGGIITSRDRLVLHRSKKKLLEHIIAFSQLLPQDDSLEKKLGYRVKAKWKIEDCKQRIQSRIDHTPFVKSILYRPFDPIYIYYDPSMIDTPSQPICSSIFGHKNLVLITPKIKTTSCFTHILLADQPIETKACSHDRSSHMFPLYIHKKAKKTPNLGHFWRRLESCTQQSLTPEAVLAYVLAILHTPHFQKNHIPLNDFPRIPLPRSAKQGQNCIRLGHQLIKIYLQPSTVFKAEPVGAEDKIERIDYHPEQEELWLNQKKTLGFKNIPEKIWKISVGGYQVCHKWLKSRKHQMSTQKDRLAFCRMVQQLIDLEAVKEQLDDELKRSFY